ncbi:MAG: phosphohistidine phosphatase SixA [Candidatus Margulisbacteria bacterium]|nr:phosphohistidine phosphatase SixA [Candidatus Margulisiibacteriota bacterium]
MKIFLMRHAEAETSEQVMKKDADRTLTEAGKLQVRVSANKLKEKLAEKDESIDLVLTSPYVRACETAAIAATVLGLDGKVIRERRLSPGADVEKIKQLEDEHRDAGNLLIVGHEPDLGIIAGQLLRLNASRPLGKAEVVEIAL